MRHQVAKRKKRVIMKVRMLWLNHSDTQVKQSSEEDEKGLGKEKEVYLYILVYLHRY